MPRRALLRRCPFFMQDAKLAEKDCISQLERIQLQRLTAPFLRHRGVKSIPIDLIHANRGAVLEIRAGAFQFGAFRRCEFCEIRIPGKNEFSHEGEGEVLIDLRQKIIKTQHFLFVGSHVIASLFVDVTTRTDIEDAKDIRYDFIDDTVLPNPQTVCVRIPSLQCLYITDGRLLDQAEDSCFDSFARGAVGGLEELIISFFSQICNIFAFVTKNILTSEQGCRISSPHIAYMRYMEMILW